MDVDYADRYFMDRYISERPVLLCDMNFHRCLVNSKMLELMDVNHDGRIRADEVIGAIDFLKSKNVDLDSIFRAGEEDEKALADVIARQGDLAKLEPSAEEKAAFAAWEEAGKAPEVAVLGDATADKQEESLKTALHRSITQCYAVEGCYPPDLKYLEEHYGLTFDEELFFVDYVSYGGNLFPEVTVLRKSN